MRNIKKAISLGATAVVAIAIILIVGFGVYLDSAFNSTTTPSLQPGGTSISTSSSSQVGSTSTSTSQSSSSFSTSPAGLSLELFIGPSNGTLGTEVISVSEYNTLNTTNNVSIANDWPYAQYSLNPYDNCGAPGPIGFAIFSGYYDLANYSSARALVLYNTTYAFTCTTTMSGNYQYSFSPDSSWAELINSGKAAYNSSLSLNSGANGYWTGGFGTTSPATFHNFPLGNYTVLAADEWGKVVMLHFTVYSNGISSGGSTTTTGSMATYSTSSTTYSEATWDPAHVANVTLNSPKIQQYIGKAYSYNFGIEQDPYGSNLVTVLINTTANQVVTGNYSSGYTVTYSGIATLNATVQFTPPSDYSLASFMVTNFPNRTESISYSQSQQRVIQVALANSTVKSDLQQISPYYVGSVSVFPISNGTYNGDYFLTISQIDGPRFVGVFVNSALTSVVAVYNDTTASTACFGSGTSDCYTSPWD